MAKKQITIDQSVGEYRRWKSGRSLDSVLQMRLCETDRADLLAMSDADGLTCSELVRVLIFREARARGLRASSAG